jgi:hypothetical protein
MVAVVVVLPVNSCFYSDKQIMFRKNTKCFHAAIVVCNISSQIRSYLDILKQ